jgi:TonB family protein
MVKFYGWRLILLVSMGISSGVEAQASDRPDLPPLCPEGSSSPVLWHNCFGSYRYPSGLRYVGGYRVGLQHGIGVVLSANGSIERSGIWVGGVLSQERRFPATDLQSLRLQAVAEGRPEVFTQQQLQREEVNSLAQAGVGQTGVARPAIGNVSACAPKGTDYPIEAARAEATGTTRVRFVVDSSGKLRDSSVVRSAGDTVFHKMLDKVALDKLNECTFRAGNTADGRAVGGTFEVEYNWKLEGRQFSVDVSKPSIENPVQCAPKNEDYPAAAIRAEAQGTTRIRFSVDSTSKLNNIEVVSPAGSTREHRQLDRVALAKLSECRFRAGISENRIPISGILEVGFVWRLPPASVGFSPSGASVPIAQPSGQRTDIVTGSTVAIPPAPVRVAPPTINEVSAQNDKLAAELALARKKQQELEERLANESKERDRLVNEARERERPSPPPPTAASTIRSAHALVIGNAAYPGSGRLDNPVNDATAISQKLRAMGFTVTTVTDANRQRLVQAMSQFRRTAASAEVSLLFYSGHGVQVFGKNYMLPTDVDQTDVAQATIQGVSLNEVVENFLPGKTKLVFLDACRDNPLQRTGDRSVSRGLAPISVAEGTLIAYATKDGQVASDGTGQRNSPFTQALLEHLSDPSDIAVVLRKVREKVMRSTGGKQQPWEYGSLTGGELVLSAIRR